MALVHDERHGLWALGPESGPATRHCSLRSCPTSRCRIVDGKDFSLRSLRGTKVFMLAWASW